MSRRISAFLRVSVLAAGCGLLALQSAARGQGDGWPAGQSAWMPLGNGVSGGDPTSVYTMETFDDGTGPALYAAGHFQSAGGVSAPWIAKWDGTTWSAVGGIFPFIYDLEVFDDGSGPALYAAGTFNTGPTKGIAKWDGTEWSSVGTGLGGFGGVAGFALAVADLGSGPALYVGGQFMTAGGTAVNNIARWDGASWSPLGAGVNASVGSLAAFDDGTGPRLCAGGSFTSAGGVPAGKIAAWDGTTWSALGSGMGSVVWALAEFDDGSGMQLYAGGPFHSAGGVPAERIARWDGTTWSPLGSGMDDWVSALQVHDDGRGPALFAGGLFTTAGGVEANYLARWDGSEWSATGSGMQGAQTAGVRALAVFDAGSGPELVVGGDFSTAGGDEAHAIARWVFVPAPWTYLGSGLGGTLGIPQFLGEGSLVAGSPMSMALTGAWPSSAAALFLSLSSTPISIKGGTLVPVPPLFVLLHATSPAGGIALTYPAWPPGASGASLYFQYAIHDPVTLQGITLSNALRADVP